MTRPAFQKKFSRLPPAPGPGAKNRFAGRPAAGLAQYVYRKQASPQTQKTIEPQPMNFEKFLIQKMHTSRARLLTEPEARNINLDVFLDYELQASSRYRRYVSVVLLKGAGNGSSYLKDIISDCIRTCDAAFAYGNYIAVLMGETDDKGSRLAIERYKKNLSTRGHQAHFASVTYPGDGTTADDLSRLLWQRIEESKSGIG
jgi:hypothetical protein